MARKGMIDFSQLEDLAEKWEKAGGKVEQLAESCLKAAHKAVTPPIVPGHDETSPNRKHAGVHRHKSRCEMGWHQSQYPSRV